MRNLLAFSFTLLISSLATNASAAGLGFNPFEKASPTSAGGSQVNRPSGPVATPASAAPQPSAVIAQPKPATPPAHNSNAQTTKK